MHVGGQHGPINVSLEGSLAYAALARLLPLSRRGAGNQPAGRQLRKTPSSHANCKTSWSSWDIASLRDRQGEARTSLIGQA